MRYQVPISFEAKDDEDAAHIASLIVGALQHYGVGNPRAGPVIQAASADADMIRVYTDGGCDLKRGGLGAWAYLIKYPDGSVIENSAAMIGTTNNRMEMLAVIKALEELEIGSPIRIYADSEYVIKGVTVWSCNWVRNGWKTRDGKAVLNKDLWEQLLGLYQVHSCEFRHVKGHSGHPDNERVDYLCRQAMAEAHKSILAGLPVEPDAGCEKVYS